MTYIINLFGIGIRYWICELPEAMYQEMQQIGRKHKVEWEQLLFDFDLLGHFGYSHWSQLSAFPEQTGFLLDPQNRIEIKQGAKFIARFRANELTNDTTLFPLYNSRQIEWHPEHQTAGKSFLLLQHEKGLIGKYKIDQPHFHIDDLEFQWKKVNDFRFLAKIKQQSQPLKRSANDALCISVQAIEL